MFPPSQFVGPISVILISLIGRCLSSTVIGIDFGSQYVKVSYVASGEDEPLPLMLNDLIERKTLNSIAFRGPKALFGTHALKPMVNQPSRGYSFTRELLGKNYSTIPTSMLGPGKYVPEFEDGSGRVMASIEEVGTVPVEYLSGIFFSRLLENLSENHGKAVRGAVITVPPHWNQEQRNAVLSAAKIAELPVLSLTSDISAASLYYGAFSAGRLWKKADWVVFVDSGASHTSVSLVKIDPSGEIIPGKKSSSGTIVQVRQTLTDTSISGNHVDSALERILTRKFLDSHPNLRESTFDDKALVRLKIEARRVKHVLSANQETVARIEEFCEDKSLNFPISRAEMEEECGPALLDGTEALIKKLLEKSSTILGEGEEIKAVIPIGGNSRVPFIDSSIKKSLKSVDLLSTTLNREECIAQGAAWYAASLGGMRVKATKLQDLYSQTIRLQYTTESSKEKSIVYTDQTLLPGHKGISFKGVKKLNGKVFINEEEYIGISINLSPETLKSIGEGGSDWKIKFWIDVNSSGIMDVQANAVLLIERIVEAKEGEEKEKKVESIALSAEEFRLQKMPENPPILAQETITKMIKKIHDDKAADALIERCAAARNTVESNIYDLKDLLEIPEISSFAEVDENTRWISLTSADERKEIEDSVSKSVLLIDEGDEDKIGIEEYQKIIDSVTTIETASKDRLMESIKRPSAIASFEKMINSSRNWLNDTKEKLRDSLTPIAQSQSDLNEFEALLSTAQKWLTESGEKIGALKIYEDPTVRCSDYSRELRDLGYAFKSLKAKKLLPPPPPPPATTTTEEVSPPTDVVSTPIVNVVSDSPSETVAEISIAEDHTPLTTITSIPSVIEPTNTPVVPDTNTEKDEL